MVAAVVRARMFVPMRILLTALVLGVFGTLVATSALAATPAQVVPDAVPGCTGVGPTTGAQATYSCPRGQTVLLAAAERMSGPIPSEAQLRVQANAAIARLRAQYGSRLTVRRVALEVGTRSVGFAGTVRAAGRRAHFFVAVATRNDIIFVVSATSLTSAAAAGARGRAALARMDRNVRA